jgi:Cft2 family RNA processing exonuclease
VRPEDRAGPAGDFHIDPWRPVQRAVITHAHSDHARFGSDVYVCHRDTAPILRKRLGDVTIETASGRSGSSHANRIHPIWGAGRQFLHDVIVRRQPQACGA